MTTRKKRRLPKYECIGDASGGDLGERIYGYGQHEPEEEVDQDALKALEEMLKRFPPAPVTPSPWQPIPAPYVPSPWTQPWTPIVPGTGTPWWITQPFQPGWVCPVCGNANSPGTHVCGYCNPRTTTITWCATDNGVSCHASP